MREREDRPDNREERRGKGEDIEESREERREKRETIIGKRERLISGCRSSR